MGTYSLTCVNQAELPKVAKPATTLTCVCRRLYEVRRTLARLFARYCCPRLPPSLALLVLSRIPDLRFSLQLGYPQKVGHPVRAVKPPFANIPHFMLTAE